MTGTATWNGTTMTFNGTNQAFSNLTLVPYASFSLFGVFSNTTAPAATAYMNAAYAGGGYPMIGTYDVNKFVTARGVVGNTGALVGQAAVGWAAQITGATTTNYYAYGVATDSSGNVFVTGQYGSAVTLYNTGGGLGARLPFTGGTDVFLVKYSPAGSLVWAAQITGTTTSADVGQAVATDSSGNVFVSGQYGAALTLYNTDGTTGATLPALSSVNSAFLAKYSSAGSVIWVARISPALYYTYAYGLATDSSGNVFVTGNYQGAVTLYNSGATSSKTLPSSTNNSLDCFVAKYSSDGSSVMWAAQITGATTSVDRGNGVATDSSGNVFVTGQYGAALTLYNSGATQSKTLASAGSGDCFVAKYSSDGSSVLWAAQIASTSGDVGQAVATDSSGNVFVTGQYSAACTLYNSGATQSKTLASAGSGDCFVAKYSSDGSSVLWAAQIASANTDIGYGVATDSSGNVFVTGYYSAALTLYNSGATQSKTLAWTGNTDCFLAKYSSDGSSVLWAAQIAGASSSSDVGFGVATDSSGNVFVTGRYGTLLTLYHADGIIGATLTASGLFLAKYSSTGYILTPTSASSNVVVDITYTGTTLSPYVNGSNQTTLTATTFASRGFYVGGPSNYFNGSVSEVLVYNSNLTITQRQTIEGYLASKWGVKSSLPTTHPFYVTPAFNRVFSPLDIPSCFLWLDAADNSTMNSTTTVTTWNDKSGLSNTMTGTATWTGSNMTFNGSTQAFSNTSFVFPYSNFSMFGVYSNTTAPASTAYMNVMYATGGYPMIGTYDVGKSVTACGVVGNTGAVKPTWAAQIAGTTTSSDYGWACATDSSGNVFVTGQFATALTLYNTGGGTGATLPTGLGPISCFLVKYSSTGTVVWAALLANASGTPYSTIGQAVTTDSAGNVFVTGQYGATLTLYNTGGVAGPTLPFSGGTTPDCFIAKYSPTGTVVWAAQIAGTTTSSEIGQGVATDSSGNVFVTGYYTAALTLCNYGATSSKTLPFTGGNDCFLAKYSSDGTSVMWAAQIAGTTTSSDVGYAVATDSSGNVFVSGSYGAALTLYNYGATQSKTLPITSGSDAFLAKYSSNGSSVMWAARMTTSGSTAWGYAVATDSSGNVFVTGFYTAALTLYNSGATQSIALPFTGGSDVFIAKYSSDGSSVMWAAQITGTTTSSDNGRAVATDSSGNVFVTGFYSAALTLYNSGATQSIALPFTGGSDVFLAKYSSDGTSVMWAAQITGAGAAGDQGQGVATDSSGNVFVTGYYQAALTLYNADGTTGATLPFTGGVDCFVAKYNSNGYILAPTSASSNVLVDVTYTGTTLSPYINGSNQTTLTATTVAATGIYVGGPTNYFNGSISELLVYGSSLTAAQRQQVEGYLTQKWGLGSQIVSTQPYKTISPTTPLPIVTASPGRCALNVLSGGGGTVSWGTLSSSADSYMWYIGSGGNATAYGVVSSNTYIGTTTGRIGVGPVSAWVTPYSAGGPGTTVYSSVSNVPILKASGTYVVYLMKYSASGVPQSAVTITQSTGNGAPAQSTMAIDPGGNMYLNVAITTATNSYSNYDQTVGLTYFNASFPSGYSTIVKYTSSGVASWVVATAGTLSTPSFLYLTTDASCNVYATGTYNCIGGQDYFYNSNGVAGYTLNPPAPTGGAINTFVIKYTTTGTVSWFIYMTAGSNTQGTNASNCYPYGITTDSSGNVIAFGTFAKAFTVYPASGSTTFAGPTISSVNSFYLVKFTSAGAISFAKFFMFPSTAGSIWGASLSAVVTDSSGNIYATCSYSPSTSTSNFSFGTTTLPNSATLGSGALLVYTSAGTPSWATYVAGGGGGSMGCLAIDSNSNLYASVSAGTSSTTLYSPTGTSVATLAASTTFIVKYSSSGALLWITSLPTGISLSSFVTDSNANLYVSYDYTSTTTQTLSNAGPTGPSSASSYIMPMSSGGGLYRARITIIYDTTGTITNTLNVIDSNSTGNVYARFPGVIPFGSNIFLGGHYNSKSGIVIQNPGFTYSTNTGGTLTLPSNAASYAYIAKWNPYGFTMWAAYITGGQCYGYGTATDTSGNLYVSGYYSAALTAYNSNGISGATLPFSGTIDTYVVKYSSAGIVSWAAYIVGGSCYNNGIATDTSGNVYVTGYYSAALTAYNAPDQSSGATLPFSGTNAAYIIKYTSSGTVSWATYITGGICYGQAITTDSTGNVYVTGQSSAALTVYNSNGTVASSFPSGGGFVAKYTSLGTLSWAAYITASGSISPNGITVDYNGNIYIVGSYSSPTGPGVLYNGDGSTSAITLQTASVLSTTFIIKYSSLGTVISTSTISANPNYGNGITTDSIGNIFVVGKYGAALTAGSVTLPWTSGTPSYLIKYTSNMVASWGVNITGTTTAATGVALDVNSNILVSGNYSATANSGTVGGSASGSPAAPGSFFIKYASDGWSTFMACVAINNTYAGRSVAADSSGNIYGVGDFLGSVNKVYNGV